MQDDIVWSVAGVSETTERWDSQDGALIARAHARSTAFGLSPSIAPDYDVMQPTALEGERLLRQSLCLHGLPIVEMLYEHIAKTQCMIALTDPHGLILHSLGDGDFLARARKVALCPGGNWAEKRQGTNAIGTSLAERSAVVIRGEQHFVAANRFLTCMGVPIENPGGEVAGVLAVVSDYKSYHQHTMALAKMSVQMIENHQFSTTVKGALQVSFHQRAECLGTLMEGIVAFTADGRFLSANRSAQLQLGMPLAALRSFTLSGLFETTAAQLIDRIRMGGQSDMMLSLSNGKVVCVRVRFTRASLVEDGQPPNVFDGNRRTVHVNARSAAGLAVEPTAGQSRLSSLNTGDPQVACVIAKVRKVTGKDIPILITGETGTGKELLAQAIHNDSPRRDAPFVAVNCASIPEMLIESELFGYEEGAFTGARRKGAIGKLLQANGGTLFLDEIGDMPYPLQMRLLRVLQERLVNPLGSTKTIAVDIAIICATHRDLREMIAQNRFREDLYYRLNGLVVRLPPLRDRTDLSVVVQKMLQLVTLDGERSPLSVAPEVMALFHSNSWPGNFRQLGNLLRTAAAMVDDDGEIRREHLPDDFLYDLCDADVQSAVDVLAGPSSPLPEVNGFPQSGTRLQDVAAAAIAAALVRHGGNVSAAARALGVSRNTIYRQRSSGERVGAA